MSALVKFNSPELGEQITDDNFVLDDEFEEWLRENRIKYTKTFSINFSECAITFCSSTHNKMYYFQIEDIRLLNEMSFEQVKKTILRKLNIIEDNQEAKDTVTIIYNGLPITMYRDDFIEFIQSHKIN